ncbi:MULTISPECIES: UbiX family flavin prenyltransferase [unclassified Mesorhizobium]|uniref:UbiX family flavin prenyltransferase n=1 Tax=unclassified Mesorhizobium TaxID=325217 RepID=UPI000FCAE382|nr:MULTISPECIES: UbiX family flavin prenyltransferase [unclassified Mesorhizobium]RUW24825.1 UbiX family flavin prenyltransferase [Mesorhizobium sp. M1E.F.Ca.ET.041.01.1.1]RUW70234.1 UbiX family flavin prenyltransferase [Mesorhizobium sp. M4B.F.Ca.ET.049.02.1.2]
MTKRIIVGVTGASGSVLALETIRQLVRAGVETHLVVSKGARITIAYELGADGLAQLASLANHTHNHQDLAAPIASGSFRTDGMIVVPCSMRTLAAMAHGLGDNLLTRAADVVLKERRRLVVVPREAPLHEGHLDAMLRLTRMGAIIAPPVPPFYVKPTSVEAMVAEMAARLVNWAGVDPGDKLTRWGEDNAAIRRSF